MKSGKLYYLLMAASVASIVLIVIAWSQAHNDSGKKVSTLDSWQVANSEPEYINDTPIQPIVAQQNLNALKVALGEKLFHETRLSVTDSVSCASCHDLERGGTDRLSQSIGVNGGVGDSNSPTIYNVSLNIAQFWDGRSENLIDQIDGPIHNENEMGSSWPQIIGKLEKDIEYQTLFEQLYPDGISSSNIKDAISIFERSLLTLNSPFDRYLRGDVNAIDDNAKKGYEKFKEYGCVACHQGRNVGGNLYQPLGVMGDYFADRGTEITKKDLGRYNVTGLEEDKFVFRVPSLRLAPLTAPYFHDGSAATLKDAVRIMIKYQLGRTASEQDEQLILDFLNSLVGEYKGKRLTL